MNSPIFRREDFVLCRVPVPLGYPQSQTHAGVALIGNHYYLSTSPYPAYSRPKMIARLIHLVRLISQGRFCNYLPAESFENPCLYKGDNDDLSAPFSFSLMQQTPLMNMPEQFYGYPSYNSDPDIFIEDRIISVLNRCVIRISESNHHYLIRIYLLRGVDEGGKFKLLSNNLFFESKECTLSPSLEKINNRYIFAYIDSNSAIDGESFTGVFIHELKDLSPIDSTHSPRKVVLKGSPFLPWHMSLFQHDGRLYAIMACVEKGVKGRIWQLLGEFNSNLTELYIYKTPLTDYNSYRGAACVSDSGIFVLYSTTVHEKINGSNSVDGRNVIMAKMPFDNLMTEIRDSES